MKVTPEHKKLFNELKEWSCRKDVFSVNEFLKERGVSLFDFELIANGNKNFMKIWDIAEDKSWGNLREALYSKSISRSQIANYIKERDVFKDEDPEEIMQRIENVLERVKLHESAMNGDVDDMVKCSFVFNMITEEQYNDFLRTTEEYGDEEDFDS